MTGTMTGSSSILAELASHEQHSPLSTILICKMSQASGKGGLDATVVGRVVGVNVEFTTEFEVLILRPKICRNSRTRGDSGF